MSVFQVRHGASGAILWTGEACTQARVLDVMAVDAGFRSGAELPSAIQGAGLIVEALRFEHGRPVAGRAGERVTGGVPLDRTGNALSGRGRGSSGEGEGVRNKA